MSTLSQRMRANAELLDAMLDNQVRLDRRALDGLVRDLWGWAEEIEASANAARMFPDIHSCPHPKALSAPLAPALVSRPANITRMPA